MRNWLRANWDIAVILLVAVYVLFSNWGDLQAATIERLA